MGIAKKKSYEVTREGWINVYPSLKEPKEKGKLRLYSQKANSVEEGTLRQSGKWIHRVIHFPISLSGSSIGPAPPKRVATCDD